MNLKPLSLLLLYMMTTQVHSLHIGRGMVSGRQAAPRQFTFVVLISISHGNVEERCTGSLIDPVWVLTAARCFVRTKGLADVETHVVAGTLDAGNMESHVQVRESVENRVHDYVADRFHQDIALVLVERPFRVSEFVSIIPLTTKPFPKSGEVLCTMVGFGYSGPSDDYETDVTADLANLQSRQLYYIEGVVVDCTNYTENSSNWRSDEYVCVNYKDNSSRRCFADSGAPLVWNGMLAGTLSGKRFTNKTMTAACGEEQFFHLYMSTYFFRSWINQTFNNVQRSSTEMNHAGILISIVLTVFTLTII